MALKSKLFRSSKRLNDCAGIDSQHVVTGDKGDFVSRIQTALLILGIEPIAGKELQQATYGPTTARSVLMYKRERSIINFAYQQTADNTVGKMTILRLDGEMFAFETRARMAGIPI